jgi:hypothetical protein
MLVGAFSSNAYGYPRATKDAVIVIEYEEGVLKKICESLGSDFKLDPQTGFELMTGSIRNILTYTPTKFEIELFRLRKDPHHRERFARRRRLALPDLQIEAVIPTAEDVVIQKLRFGFLRLLVVGIPRSVMTSVATVWSGRTRSWRDADQPTKEVFNPTKIGVKRIVEVENRSVAHLADCLTSHRGRW